MKSKVIVHERPSAIERLFSKVLNNCELVYVPPKRKPKKDPYEGLNDKQIITKLKEENRSFKEEIYSLKCKVRRLESESHIARSYAILNNYNNMMRG